MQRLKSGGLLASGLLLWLSAVHAAAAAVPPTGANLWSHDNLFAWCVVPFDAKKRGPEERAQMLEALGFKYFVYDWRDEHIPTFDAEIDALEKRHITLMAWWFPLEADDPTATVILEVFKRHHIHPQLWVPQSFRGSPKTPEDWAKVLRVGFPVPKTGEDWQKLSDSDKAEMQSVAARLDSNRQFPKTPEEQAQRVKREADRIYALAKLAAPYGSPVELYNHNGWYGVMDNQVAIIKDLKARGVNTVGIAYNFTHARDELHDDSVGFSAAWKKIKPYVVAVEVTGMATDGKIIYPSQGDSELSMMQTIHDSGWSGPIGLIAEKGGDAEVTLKNYLTGLDWLASELKEPGSGGPRPFPLDR